MRTLFSTTDVHPRDRFDYWHDIACKNIINRDSRPTSRPTFHAELQAGLLGDIGVFYVDVAPMSIVRTRYHVAHLKDDDLLACRLIAGTLALEQEGRELSLEPGDFTLLDPRVPYVGGFPVDSRVFTFKIPRRLLEARLGQTQKLTGRCLKPSSPENSLTSAFLAMLPVHAEGLSAPAAALVRDQALDLLAMSLSKAGGNDGPRLSSARSLILVKLRAAIEARLTDPALNACMVAAAAGVSLRYANAVLAEENMSVMRLIQARRLERCRKALEDPLQRSRSVSEIAYSWGFSDMTHFGRKFKAAYGMLPSEYRRLARAN